MRSRYARTPSRPRLTSAFCHVTTTFGCRYVSSRSISPFLMASSRPSRSARSSLCAGSSVAESCDSATEGMRRNGARSGSAKTVIHFFMAWAFKVVVGDVVVCREDGRGALRQSGRPLEELDQLPVVRREVLRPVLCAADVACLGFEVAVREHAPNEEIEPV